MSIIINIAKAKAIKLDAFRAERAPLLAALDLAYMRAIEQGDTPTQVRIAAQKQALRDVTKVTLPNDIDALKAFKPEVLS